MLLVLTAALLPLGLIALVASVQSVHGRQQRRAADVQVMATAEARQIDILLLRGSSIIRSTLALGPLSRERCERVLTQSVAAFGTEMELATFDAAGHRRCATRRFRASAADRAPGPRTIRIEVDHAAGLRFTVGGMDGSYGMGLLSTAALNRALPMEEGSQSLTLIQGTERLALLAPVSAPALGLLLHTTAPIGDGQALLQLDSIANPVSLTEILLVLLPLGMWAAAAAIGWIVADQLLVRPLAQLQRAVTAYGDGGTLEMPRISTPSQEIRAVADAFQATTAKLAEREAELEQGLEHQVRLTREVHHRVKNNLQVVASLINLHARGTDGDVAGAYASIQRRVDALAVVHRNHYAELEENRGVALRSIVAELTANLRATAPPSARHMAITLDMAPASITQDVAVPVAFLVTELVELVMRCDPAGCVAITLTPGSAESRAILRVVAPGLSLPACRIDPHRERFERIVLGLSRQLRAPLENDTATGTYSIEIAVFPPIEEDTD